MTELIYIPEDKMIFVQFVQKDKLTEAVEYIAMNPTLSFHHVANEFDVDVHDLQKTYALKYNAGRLK